MKFEMRIQQFVGDSSNFNVTENGYGIDICTIVFEATSAILLCRNCSAFSLIMIDLKRLTCDLKKKKCEEDQ